MIDVRTLYREIAARGASPVRQVVLLYVQIVEVLRRARKAIEENHIEGRTQAINHAITVIAHLQSKFNLEAGGDVARHLERFYNMVRRRLLEAQVQASKEVLDEQIPLVLELRDAWTEVGRAEAVHLDPTLAPSKPETTNSVDGQKIRTDWRG